MKIQKSNKNKKIIVALLILLVLFLSAGLFFFIKHSENQNISNKNADTSTTSKPERSSSDEDQAANLKDNSENKENNPNTDTPIPDQAPNPSSGKRVVQVIASSDSSNGHVYIRGGVGQLVSDGECYAKLTGPNGETLMKDTTLLQNSSTTDCKTIDITPGELSAGRWSYQLVYNSDVAEGKSSEGTFNF